MTIAKSYFEEQFKNQEFRNHYLKEKQALDIEYLLEEIKQDIIKQKPISVLLSEVEDLKKMITNQIS
jgi:polyhydroxyalkanoate synthesis regulator phasin